MAQNALSRSPGHVLERQGCRSRVGRALLFQNVADA
jgi:hypothetical protein